MFLELTLVLESIWGGLSSSLTVLSTLDILKERADLHRYIRAFFEQRRVLEVDVPVIGRHTVTDVFLEPLTTTISDCEYFLQTSPEYYMKRLLAEGSGSIFNIGKAFRQDEQSRKHRPEFTMLEWYRLGLDDRDLMLEVQAFLLGLAPSASVIVLTYGDLFSSVLGLCPHAASESELHDLAMKKTSFEGELESKSAYLDLLFSLCVEPVMSRGLVFVHDYPMVQSALARVTNNEQGQKVARRFEVFWDGVELANGYWELVDSSEQRQRFAADLDMRKSMGLAVPTLDQAFLAALDSGVPECAGVALGVDRLLMCMLGRKDIADVMSFPNN